MAMMFNWIPRVYDECNGSGFELSGTTFDLRFVPADMEFSSPASACRSLPQPDRYKPKAALINFDDTHSD